MTSVPVVQEVVEACAAYRDKYREWPTQVRLDASRFRALALALTEDGFRRLAAHVRLTVRDAEGTSAGGRGVVDFSASEPSSTALDLARAWLGDFAPRSDQRPESPRIAVIVSYWRDLASRALDRFGEAAELDLENLVLAADQGPNRIVIEREAGRLDVLFHAVCLGSFGLQGVAPKTLAIGRRSYGSQPDPNAEPVLLLHRDDGLVVTMDAPFHLCEAFPVDRSRWTDAVMEFAEALAELANRLRTGPAS